MEDTYVLSALKVLKCYFDEVDMPVKIVREEEDGSYHLVQTIQLDENEEIGVSYTVNSESATLDETLLIRFTAPFNCDVPDDKINDVLLYLNTLNMHNSVGHYYLLGSKPVQTYEYAVPAETVGESITFIEIMFLFGYSLIAANDSVVKMIEENITSAQAYIEFVTAYYYFTSEKDESDFEDE